VVRILHVTGDLFGPSLGIIIPAERAPAAEQDAEFRRARRNSFAVLKMTEPRRAVDQDDSSSRRNKERRIRAVLRRGAYESIDKSLVRLLGTGVEQRTVAGFLAEHRRNRHLLLRGLHQKATHGRDQFWSSASNQTDASLLSIAGRVLSVYRQTASDDL